MNILNKRGIFIILTLCFLLVGCSTPKQMSAATNTCSLIVDCSAALSADDGGSGKHELIPENGIIFSSQSVSFSEGENAFIILERELKNNKIHFEKSGSPLYIKGIGNIYERDFGDMSGWVYTVNDQSPTVSCDSYYPKDGDVIKFEYITSWE